MGWIGSTNRTIEQIVADFWNRVQKTDGCWLWTGAKNKRQYGHFAVGGKHMLSHRFSFLLHNLYLPAELHICHKCDNPPCCNPHHLFAGTRSDNLRDAVAKGIQLGNLGEKRWNSKLKDADILRIRNDFTGQSHASVARLFKVDPSVIVRVRSGERWSHVVES